MTISNTGATRSIVELARIARENGARIRAITGTRSAPLASHAHVVINVETLDNTDVFTPTTSRIAALVAADILSTLVARRLGPEHNRRLVRMKRRLSRTRRSEAFRRFNGPPDHLGQGLGRRTGGRWAVPAPTRPDVIHVGHGGSLALSRRSYEPSRRGAPLDGHA